MTKDASPWGERATEFFYKLTPEKILGALEASLGVRCTGRSFAHNSLENRVYELEIELDGDRSLSTSSFERYKIVKFYRPSRWTKEQILEEHAFLNTLKNEDIPVVAPLPFQDGQTLHTLTESNIHYAVFPKVGGRAPEELTKEQVERIARLMARVHAVGAQMKPKHRIAINQVSYGLNNLSFLLSESLISPSCEAAYESAVRQICDMSAPWFETAASIQLHGDCHLGNILWGPNGPFLVDFDDSVIGPPIQDLWLLLPGRDRYAQEMLQQILSSYQMMREFDMSSIRLIEPLRALRMIHFSAWVGKRRQDPAFMRYFPDYGSERYWQIQLQDLREQIDAIQNQARIWQAGVQDYV